MADEVQVKLTWKGTDATDEMLDAVTKGLQVGAEYLLTEANKSVPLDESTLEKSGHTSVDRRLLTSAISYDTPYAVRQHEDMTLRHTPGRRAKWLELTGIEHGKEAAAIIATQVRRRTGGAIVGGGA